MSISIKAKYDNHEGKGKAITSSSTTKMEAVYLDTEYRIFIVYVCGHKNLSIDCIHYHIIGKYTYYSKTSFTQSLTAAHSTLSTKHIHSH